jgi:hypothetical protein
LPTARFFQTSEQKSSQAEWQMDVLDLLRREALPVEVLLATWLV